MSNNFSNDYKLLLVLRAVRWYYEVSGDYHLGICSRVMSLYSYMHLRLDSNVEAMIEKLIASWPDGTGSVKYPINVNGSDLHEQFKNMLTKKKDWVDYRAYAERRMALLRHMIETMEDVCS